MRALKVGVVCVLGLVGVGRAEVAATGPAGSMPAAAIPAGGPLRVLVDSMVLATVPGKEKEVLALYHFANDDERKEVETAIASTMSYYSMLEAMRKAYPGAKVTDVRSMAEMVETQLARSVVKEEGEVATVTFGGNSVTHFVKVEGRWKLDFAKTDRMRGGLAKQNMEQVQAAAKIWSEMTAEVVAKKYATYEEAQAEIQKRMMAVPGMEATQEKAQHAAAVASRGALTAALVKFEVDNGRYPTTEEGLMALAHAPAGIRETWRGPYLTKIPKDSWGRPYIYKGPDAVEPGKYKVWSNGPDGQEGTEDDVQ